MTFHIRIIAPLQLSFLGLSVAVALGCGGGPPPAEPVVQRQGPEEEILSIASAWEARSQDRGLRSEPSKVSVYSANQLSGLSFLQGKPTAQETILVEEAFRLRDGRKFACRTEAAQTVGVRFFRKGEEPAVEVTRSDAMLTRQCDQPGFPEPNFSLATGRSSFMLRDERLVGFDPPLEKRSYIPVQ